MLVNDWVTVDEIVHGIYDGKLDLTLSRPLLQSFFDAIEWLIGDQYRKISPASCILKDRFLTENKAKRLQKYKIKSKSATRYHTCTSNSSKAEALKIRTRQIQRATAFDESLLVDLKKVLGSLGVYLAFNEIIF